jgi:hypothetical protein
MFNRVVTAIINELVEACPLPCEIFENGLEEAYDPLK